jgi:hypothetical protein
MRKTAFLLVLVAAAFAAPQAFPAGPSNANGGGIGTIDGTSPFSHFGFGVTFGAGGTAQGHFNCLMAGNAAFPGFEPLMKVDGRVSAGSVSPALGSAEFTGTGTLNLGPSGRMPALFHVAVTDGAAGVGTLTLTVIAPAFPLPTETVMAGRITVR